MFSWPGKVQATFPIMQPLTSCVACSVPVPLGFPLLQLFPLFPESFLSLWTNVSLNQFIFPGSCSQPLSCFLIPTLHLFPACLLTGNWNAGQGHPGSALVFYGQCWWQNGFFFLGIFGRTFYLGRWEGDLGACLSVKVFPIFPCLECGSSTGHFGELRALSLGEIDLACKLLENKVF